MSGRLKNLKDGDSESNSDLLKDTLIHLPYLLSRDQSSKATSLTYSLSINWQSKVVFDDFQITHI